MIVELCHGPLENTDECVAVGGRGGARGVELAGRVPVGLLHVEVRVLLAHEFAERREVGGTLFREEKPLRRRVIPTTRIWQARRRCSGGDVSNSWWYRSVESCVKDRSDGMLANARSHVAPSTARCEAYKKNACRGIQVWPAGNGPIELHHHHLVGGRGLFAAARAHLWNGLGHGPPGAGQPGIRLHGTGHHRFRGRRDRDDARHDAGSLGRMGALEPGSHFRARRPRR